MRKKRLLFVINTMGRAGAEKSLVEFLNTLDGERFDIDLLSMINRGEMFLRVPAHVRILNKRPDSGSVLTVGGRLAVMRCAVYSLLRGFWLFRNLGYMLKNLSIQKKHGRVRGELALWQAIADGAAQADGEYDLAVAYIEGASSYYVARRVRAVRKCTFLHTDYIRAGYTPYIDKRCYDCFDRIFAVSKQAAARFSEAYPEYEDKVFLFRNIINSREIKRCASLPGGYGDEYEGLRLLTVGRICPEKGYDVAIAAAELLKKSSLNFRWYVLGDGADRKKTEALIKKRGVEDVFILLGAADNPYNYMAQTDIYVHETRYEGKSVAVEEAQTLCLPIIASDCEGNLEQITHGVDGIITPLEPERIAAAITELAHNRALMNTLKENTKKKQLQNSADAEAFMQLLEADGNGKER